MLEVENYQRSCLCQLQNRLGHGCITLAPKLQFSALSAPYTHTVPMILLLVRRPKIMASYGFPDQSLSLATVPTTSFAAYPLLNPPRRKGTQKHRAKPILAVYLLRLSNCGTISPYILHEKHKTPPPANAFF